MTIENRLSDVAELGEWLCSNNLSLAVAESCTGGSLGAYFSEVNGASSWFAGGVICYQIEVKSRVLSVSDELIDRFGVVSSPVVKAMSEGLQRIFPDAICVSVTGWLNNAPEATNEGADSPIVPGLVWFGVSIPGSMSIGKVNTRTQTWSILLEDLKPTRNALRETLCVRATTKLYQLLATSEGSAQDKL